MAAGVFSSCKAMVRFKNPQQAFNHPKGHSVGLRIEWSMLSIFSNETIRGYAASAIWYIATYKVKTFKLSPS